MVPLKNWLEIFIVRYNTWYKIRICFSFPGICVNWLLFMSANILIFGAKKARFWSPVAHHCNFQLCTKNTQQFNCEIMLILVCIYSFFLRPWSSGGTWSTFLLEAPGFYYTTLWSKGRYFKFPSTQVLQVPKYFKYPSTSSVPPDDQRREPDTARPYHVRNQF